MEYHKKLNDTKNNSITSPFTPVHDTPIEKKPEHPLTEIIKFSLIALIIVVPIRMFVAQPFIVSGASMEDTFQSGEYLIVDQLTYHFEAPQRGDVVVFRYPRDPSKFFIKRVIGMPEDTLTIDGNIVKIKNDEYPEEIVLDEPYIRDMKMDTQLTVVLGSGEYFVMGDNRNASSDSRTWGILEENKIIGRALLRLFPFSSVDIFPGLYDIDKLLEQNTSR